MTCLHYIVKLLFTSDIFTVYTQCGFSPDGENFLVMDFLVRKFSGDKTFRLTPNKVLMAHGATKAFSHQLDRTYIEDCEDW